MKQIGHLRGCFGLFDLVLVATKSLREGGGGGEGFIDVDGTPLAGKYLGTLIMVCACDIKSHIFPIA